MKALLQMKLCLIFVAFLFTGRVYAQSDEAASVPWTEGFETEADFEKWTILDLNEDGVSGSTISAMWARSTALKHGGTHSAAYRFSNANNADDWLISPPIALEAGKSYKLKWWDYTSGSYQEKYTVKLGTSAKPEDMTIELEDFDIKTGKWVERSEAIPISTTGVYYLGWYCHSDKAKATLYIDDVSLDEINPVDMKVINIVGSKEASVKSSISHTITVQNNGAEAISAFSVSILDNSNNSLSTVAYTGEALEPDEIAEIPISWTPTANMEGAHVIKALVQAAGDAVKMNDTLTFDMTIHPFATFMHHIGDINSTAYGAITPFYFYAANSGTQNLYFEEEISEYGYIQAIRYYTDFRYYASNNQELKIYLAVTDREDLSGQWVLDTLLVCEEVKSFEMGKYEVTFRFKEPFLYTGGNLVITTMRSGEGKSGQYFKSTASLNKTARSRWASGSTPFDFSQVGTLVTVAPNVSMLIEANGGVVKGHVRTDSGLPIKNASVKAVSATSDYEVKTNEDGEYVFNFLPTDEYNIIVSRAGYEGDQQSATVSYRSTEEIDFTMNSLIQINLTGAVRGDKEEKPMLEQATVILNGEEVFQVLTDAEGKFNIEGVFGTRRYDLHISYSGYKTRIEPLILGETDMDLGDIVLESCAPPSLPRNLTATLHTEDWYDVRLSWEAPEENPFVNGYRIYRNDTLLNPFVAVADFSFTDHVFPGHYTYEISILSATGCESERIGMTVEMEQNPCELAITAYPFVEDFENGQQPDCWTQEYIIGKTAWVVTDDNDENNLPPYNGSYNVRIVSIQKGTITKLMLPMLDLTSLEKPVLSFYRMQKRFGSAIDVLRVYYKKSAESEWTLLKEYLTDQASWSETVIELPEASATYELAFEAEIFYGRGIHLDDIKIFDQAVCSPANNFRIVQEAEASLLLEWDIPHGIGVKSYKIERDGVLLADNITTTSYRDVTVAVGAREYCLTAVYETKEDCSEAPAVCENFMVAEMCDAVTDLTLEILGNKEVGISWTAPNATFIDSYSIYKDGGEEPFAKTSATTWKDTEVQNGNHQYCVMVNYNSTKSCSVSEPVCGEIMSLCDPVSKLTAVFDAEENIVRLNWAFNLFTPDYNSNQKELATFDIYRNNVKIVTTKEMNYKDWYVGEGGKYSYSVVPNYATGCIGDAAHVDISIDCVSPAKLTVDVNANANGDGCAAELSWYYPQRSQEDLHGASAGLKVTSEAPEAFNDIIFPAISGDFPTLTNPVGQTPSRAPELVFDNGPLKTHEGIGFNGADLSVRPPQLGTFATTAVYSAGYIMGEDFFLEAETHISEFEFFALLWDSSTYSKFDGAYLTIFKEHPFLANETQEVIWGDLSTNRMSETSFTNMYRVTPDALDMFWYPIMSVKVAVDITLPKGTYYFLYGLTAPVESFQGPNIPPITIYDEVVEGNAFQYHASGMWRPQINDAATGIPLGAPFRIYGNVVTPVFDIYRNNTLIASNVQGDSYTDNAVPAGSNTWSVSYSCKEGESVSNEVTATCQPVGINDMDTDNIIVYPNPTTDKIFIRSKDESINSILLFDVTGRLLHESDNINQTEANIDLADFADGVYFLNINGKTTKVLKK